MINGFQEPIHRRSFLRFMAAGSAAMAFAPGRVLARAAKSPKAKSVILLWMGGGPSQLDTFDPKPGTETGGEFKAIDTPVKGMKVAEVLPLVAEAELDAIANEHGSVKWYAQFLEKTPGIRMNLSHDIRLARNHRGTGVVIVDVTLPDYTIVEMHFELTQVDGQWLIDYIE